MFPWLHVVVMQRKFSKTTIDDDCQCKRIAKRFQKAICFVKKMMHLKAYICCSEDIYLAFVASLCNSIENIAININSVSL